MGGSLDFVTHLALAISPSSVVQQHKHCICVAVNASQVERGEPILNEQEESCNVFLSVRTMRYFFSLLHNTHGLESMC